MTNATVEPFSSHLAQLDTAVMQCTLRVLKMNGSTMLFLNGSSADRLDELAVAMPARGATKETISTTFIGDPSQSDSLVLATKLSARYGRQFYVSMNLQLDHITKPIFEKALVSYMQENLKQFV